MLVLVVVQELRERNWKAMDAVAATEKSCKDKIAANKVNTCYLSKKFKYL